MKRSLGFEKTVRRLAVLIVMGATMLALDRTQVFARPLPQMTPSTAQLQQLVAPIALYPDGVDLTSLLVLRSVWDSMVVLVGDSIAVRLYRVTDSSFTSALVVDFVVDLEVALAGIDKLHRIIRINRIDKIILLIL